MPIPQELISFLKQIGIAGLLALAIYAALKGWIVGGRHFDRAVADAESWKNKYLELLNSELATYKQKYLELLAETATRH